MSTLPALAKENGADRTPLSNRRLPPPKSAGRSFGTPLSNYSTVPSRSLTTSKKAQLQLRQPVSSSKKLVRARKLVQQYKSPTPPSAPVTTTPLVAGNTDATTTTSTSYVITFPPTQTMGLQLEPVQEFNDVGCRIHSFHDENPQKPSYSRSQQVKEGDVILKINKEAVSHMRHGAIVDKLKAMAHLERNVVFGRRSVLPQVPPNESKNAAGRLLKSNGTFTPVPQVRDNSNMDVDSISSDKKSVSSVVFMDPAKVRSATTTPNSSSVQSNCTIVRPGLSAPSPYSPFQALRLQNYNHSVASSNDLVLDVKDDSIDRSSNISPTKVKNLNISQDPELGQIGSIDFSGLKPEESVAMMLRNVFTAGAMKQNNNFNFGATKTQPSQDVQMDAAIFVDEKKEGIFQQLKNMTMPDKPQDSAWLESCLTESNNQREMLQKELKLSNTNLDEKVNSITVLERELQEAKARVSALTTQKDESQAALDSIQQQLKEVETTTEGQKSSQRETQLQVAKLQTELRDEKKEVERLQAAVAVAVEKQQDAESRLKAAEAELKAKQEELEGTKCMMETYEERFIERENELDLLTEEKDFAGRELAFARSEIQNLKLSLQERAGEVNTTRLELKEKVNSADNEIQRLNENITMATKELADQKQQSYDRERDLQARLAQVQSEISKMKASAADAKAREQSLEDDLKKRDADLEDLNCTIDTKVSQWDEALKNKEDALQEALVNLEKTKTEKAELEQEHQGLKDEHASDVSRLQATIAQKNEEISSQLYELDHTRQVASKERDLLEKEIKELKDTGSAMYLEKCQVANELQATKFEISEQKQNAAQEQDSLLRRCRETDGKLKDLEAQLKEKENEQGALNGKLDRAQQKIESLSSDLAQKDATLETVTSELRCLEDTHGAQSRQLKVTKTDLEEKERERQSLKAQHRDTKSELFEVSSRVSFLERQLNESEATTQLSEKQVSALKEEVSSLNNQVESQRVSLDSTAWELATKSMEVTNLATKLENVVGERDVVREELERKIQSLENAEAQYTELNKYFEAAGKELEAMTGDLVNAQDDIAEKTQSVSQLEKQVSSLRQHVKEGEDESSRLRFELAAEKEKATDLAKANETQHSNWEREKIELREEVSKHSALTKALEEECQTRTTDNTKLAGEIKALEQKLSNTRSLFGTEQNKHLKIRDGLDATISSLGQEVASLTQKLGATTTELKNVQKTLRNATNDYDNQSAIASKNAESKDSKISELLTEKEKATKALANLQEELSLSRLEIQRLNDSGKRSRDEVDSISALIETMQADHTEQLKLLKNKFSDEVGKLSKEKEDAESSLRRLQGFKASLQKRIEHLEIAVEEEREKNDCLALEQEALTTSCRRAEDKAADLALQVQLLEEQQANDSIDSVDSATLALSKSELRSRCKNLAETVLEAETRAAVGTSSASQRQQHIMRLEGDLAEMSSSLGDLVITCENLEAALLNARMEKATAEAATEELQKSTKLLQAQKSALKEELDLVYRENTELVDEVRDGQRKVRASEEREGALGQDLAESRQALQLLSDAHAEDKNDVERLTQELETVKENRENVLARVGALQADITKLEQRLETSVTQKELLQSESQNASERFESQLREIKNECSSLRNTISCLEAEQDSYKTTIATLEESKVEQLAKLERERSYGLKQENLRGEAVTKLAEASRVLAAQKGIINVQKQRATDAEGKAKKLAETLAGLREEIHNLESASEEKGVLRSSQIQEMEKKRTALEKASVHAKAEAETLRNELRTAERRATEINRINKTQESRINELKNTADSTKAQLREARAAWAESEKLSRSLENAVQQGKAENDSLRAKLALNGATIARLRSDRALFQEATLHAESSRGGDPNSLASELSKLEAEISLKSSQLSSASNNLRNYKRRCSEMRNSEKGLVVFIEDIIVQTKGTFDELSRLSCELKALSPKPAKQLDLAAPGTPQKVIDDANKCCLGNVVALIKEASSMLTEKSDKLENWKQECNLHSTPKGKSQAPTTLLSPTEASASRAFRRMKDVVRGSSSFVDQSKVDEVIMSCEVQMDSLVTELKAAHQALRAKEKVFSEQQAKIYELESSSKAKKKKLAGELSPIREDDDEKTKLKEAGVRTLAKCLENNDRAKASSGLHQWSKAVCAIRVEEQQNHAEAMSRALEQTQEKFAHLKESKKRSKAPTPTVLSS